MGKNRPVDLSHVSLRLSVIIFYKLNIWEAHNIFIIFSLHVTPKIFSFNSSYINLYFGSGGGLMWLGVALISTLFIIGFSSLCTLLSTLSERGVG